MPGRRDARRRRKEEGPSPGQAGRPRRTIVPGCLAPSGGSAPGGLPREEIAMGRTSSTSRLAPHTNRCVASHVAVVVLKGYHPAMLTVALISQKGGAGKTTLACALAVAAVRTGLSTVLVDLDPQGSAATWHDLRTADTPIFTRTTEERLTRVLAAAGNTDADLAVIDTAPHVAAAARRVARISSSSPAGQPQRICRRSAQASRSRSELAPAPSQS